MTTTLTRDFDTVGSPTSLGYSKPQKMGNKLWLPMFLMAVMAFPVALVLSWVRGATIAGIADATSAATAGADLLDAAQLGHQVAAFGFIGFLAVFAAVSFAIARILGRFRKGGGDVQETVGKGVQTLEMPATAKGFMLFMMMGMMTIGVSVVLHFVAAFSDWEVVDLRRWAIVLEGFRRVGVAMYLFGILLGLGTIIHVLRFQAIRIRELAGIS